MKFWIMICEYDEWVVYDWRVCFMEKWSGYKYETKSVEWDG